MARLTGAGAVTWDGVSLDGRDVVPGIYHARIRVGSRLQILKLVRLSARR